MKMLTVIGVAPAQRCCVWLPFRFTGHLQGLSLSPSTKLTLV